MLDLYSAEKTLEKSYRGPHYPGRIDMSRKSSKKRQPQNQTRDIRDRIVTALLPDVSFDGWTSQGLEQAALKEGFGKGMAAAVFPGGLDEAVAHFSDMADRWMLERLEAVEPEDLRVRDRIREAVMARFRGLHPWRDAVRQALAYGLVPWRAGQVSRHVWCTADTIWRWAGDTSTDYNYYTKRLLLSGVIKTTTIVWLNDQSLGFADTAAFLDRRIENVMQLGQVIGKTRKKD